MVIVDLATALICFAGHCYPALLGKATPPGTYMLTQRETRHPGFGGDVISFKPIDAGSEYSIHRTWRGREGLYVLSAERRRYVSSGCINVQPDVYAKLVACCNQQPVEIR